MLDEASKSVWYGKLKTSSSVSPVIFDPKLPHVPGRVFLYNADRKAIVQYVREMVDPLLIELGDPELKNIRQEIDSDWKKVRKAFMAAQPKPLATGKRQAAKVAPKEEAVLEEADADDGDWGEEFDED